jgi:very-short-patch-repair endonuclease
MFIEQFSVEADLSHQLPFLKGKGEMAVEQPAPGAPLPGVERGAEGVRSPIILGQPVTSTKVQLARELRQNMTAAEKALWQAVRSNRLNGWRFRRQPVIGGFIVDFYCHAAALAVELDGDVHETQQVAVHERDELIRDYGVEGSRFPNRRVMTQLPLVLHETDELCRKRAAGR